MPKKPKKDKQQLFEETCRRMEGEGYRRTDLTISAKKLNLIALLVIVPIIGIPCVLFILRWNLLAGAASPSRFRPGRWLLSLLALLSTS